MSNLCLFLSIFTLSYIPTTFADTAKTPVTVHPRQGSRLGLSVHWDASQFASINPSGGSVRIRFPSGISIEPTIGYQHIRYDLLDEQQTDRIFSSSLLVRVPIATHKNTELLALAGLNLGMTRSHSIEDWGGAPSIEDDNQAFAGLQWGIGIERFLDEEYSLGIRAISNLASATAATYTGWTSRLGPFADPQYQLSATMYF